MYTTQPSKNLLEDVFELGAKKVKRKHIKDQVHMIPMNKPGGNKAVILPRMTNLVRIHHQAI